MIPGLPTLKDIMAELAKPGRDPRARLENIAFAEGIEKITDLVPGMKLPGVVTNITAFGAFIDIGVHQDGLVHLSELADRYVKFPGDVVKVSQRVEVTVLAVDLERNRISLSMKTNPDLSAGKGEGAKPSGPKNGPRTGEDKRGKKGPGAPRAGKPKPVKEEPKPFNNPFANALNKLKK